MTLSRSGFTVAKDALDPSLSARLELACERLAALMTDEDRARHVSTGSLISVWRDPIFAELIASTRPLEALGYARPRFSNGYILRKPPRSPALFWHQDWWAWNEPASFDEAPLQLGLIYYLGGATRENGALRVLPGSHRAPPKLLEEHDPDIASLRARRDPHALEHGSIAGEVDVPISARDVAIVDARIFHAAHANASDRPRTAITLWYFPDYDALPESLRATIGTQAPPETWPAETRARIAPLLPYYTGSLAPRPYLTVRPR